MGRDRLGGGEAALETIVPDDGLADPGFDPELRPGMVDGLDHGVELVLQDHTQIEDMIRAGQDFDVEPALGRDPPQIIERQVVVVARRPDDRRRHVIDLQKVVEVGPQVVVIGVQHPVRQVDAVALGKHAQHRRVDCSFKMSVQLGLRHPVRRVRAKICEHRGSPLF